MCSIIRSFKYYLVHLLSFYFCFYVFLSLNFLNCRKKNGFLINTWSMQWISLICQHMQIKFQQIRKRIFHLINRRSHQTSWDFSFFLMLYKHEKNQLAGVEEGASQDSGYLSFTVRRADWGLHWTGQPDFSWCFVDAA